MVSWAVQKQRLSGVSTAAPVQTSDDYFISSCFLVLQTSCRPGFGCLSCQKRGVGGFEMEGGEG